MSNPVRDDETALLGATDLDMRAADWLQRRHFWKWKDEDQAALDAWLAQSPAHEVAYWRLEAAWNDTHRLAALHRPEQERTPPARRWRLLGGIAAGAAAAIVVLGVSLPSFFASHNQRSYATALGERKTVMLGDGSRIELNTNSALRIVAGASGRSAWLDRGEAYFEIVHNAEHPFVVTVGKRRVTDLGTKFVIRRDADQLSVSLVEGRARFDAMDGAVLSPVFLKPGDTIEEKNHSIIAIRRSAMELKDDLGWRHGLLVFKHATIAAAAAEFNRYNGRKIVVADAAAAHISIGGTFQSNNVAVFAEAVRDLLGLHVENRGGETVISR
jgi:transmembrane sensor